MLHDYSRFRITTIDSFFQSIVRELAYELDLTANLRVDINSKEALAETVKSIVSDINIYTDEAESKEKMRLMGILTSFMFERIDADKSWNILGEIENFSGNIFKEEYLKQPKTQKVQPKTQKVQPKTQKSQPKTEKVQLKTEKYLTKTPNIYLILTFLTAGIFWGYIRLKRKNDDF